jgi:hypothetical protein
MWHTSTDIETHTGPLAFILASSLHEMLQWLLDAHEMDENDDSLVGYPAFVSQTLEQKAWTLNKIAFSLLIEETPVFPLSAYSEAALDSVLQHAEGLLEMEIEISKNEDNDDTNYYYLQRKALLLLIKTRVPELLES